MQEKKPNQLDDLDIINTSGGNPPGSDTLDLSGYAAQPTYNFDCDYNSMTYSAANISTITIPVTTMSGSGGSGSTGSNYYTFSTGSGGGGTGGYILSDTISSWDQSKINIDRNGIDMPHDSDLKIGDRSLKEFMERVEERLAILQPNPKIEERWEELKKLRTAYDNLLKDILEKEKIMDILKKQ